MTNETVMTNHYQFAYKAMRLNSAPVSNNDSLLNFNKGANKTSVADDAFIEINRLNDFYVFSKLNIPDRYSFEIWRIFRQLIRKEKELMILLLVIIFVVA